MRHRPVQSDPSERGSAMLEFAFTAAIVFTLVFGMMLLALGLYTYEVVNQYARDASRYAIVHGAGCSYTTTSNGTTTTNSCSICTGGKSGADCTTAPAALQTFLATELYPGINGNNVVVNTTYGTSPIEGQCSVATYCDGSGDQVSVTVSYNYLYAIPFVRSRNFTMKAISVMTISQ